MKSVTSQTALNRLKSGNKRFVADKPNHELQDRERREELEEGQHPFAVILSCADSRVIPELVFDTGLGELFVVRVAGNVANTSSIASIEYAVANLGTKLIVVLGHESCGAVTAAMGGGDNGYNLNHLLAHIVPAVNGTTGTKSVERVVKTNAKMTVKELKNRSPIIDKCKGLKIVGAYYELGTGKVKFL